MRDTGPTLLDLFCGAGGAAMGYRRAGFGRIIGVDNAPQPNYPFEFVLADAMTFPPGGFDFIHASPPCQKFSRLRSVHPRKRYPDYLTPTRKRLQGKKYVIENVVEAPLIDPIRLCGSYFGLRVRRHRLFESSLLLRGVECRHEWQDRDRIFDICQHGRWFKSGVAYVHGNTSTTKAYKSWHEAMGIDWMTHRELTQAIPPAYTEYIGRQLLPAIQHQLRRDEEAERPREHVT